MNASMSSRASLASTGVMEAKVGLFDTRLARTKTILRYNSVTIDAESWGGVLRVWKTTQ